MEYFIKFSNYPGHQYLIIEKQNYVNKAVSIDIDESATFYSFQAYFSVIDITSGKEGNFDFLTT